jgi:hypothetical protein
MQKRMKRKFFDSVLLSGGSIFAISSIWAIKALFEKTLNFDLTRLCLLFSLFLGVVSLFGLAMAVHYGRKCLDGEW